MTKREKRLTAIRRNPHGVRVDEACAAAEIIGFRHQGGEGSHKVYVRDDEPMIMNFQNRNGLIAEYQARQLIAMIEKYGENQ